MIIINGREFDLSDASILDMLQHMKLNQERIVVEVNRAIVEKKEYGQTILNAGDQVEIVQFVGGG